MRLAIALLVALALAGAARAGDMQVATLPAIEDLSLPFWCDWGYDWDERCYWLDSDRLVVGGAHDKVWRAGLRFSLDAVPPEAGVVAAEVSLFFEQTCISPSRCDDRGFELDLHPIFTPRWRSEREVEFGPLVAWATVEPEAPPRWLFWDVTDLVADWRSGRMANSGMLLKLADRDESFDSGGPAFPSSTYPDPDVRPRLTIWYLLDRGSD